MRPFNLFLWVLLTLPTLALAETPLSTDTPSEETYYDELPNILSVSRLSQPLRETSAAVTVIDREMIKASGFFDIGEIMRLVPGMAVAYNPGFIFETSTATSYHGLTGAYSSRMQVLIDGRSVYTPLFGGVSWSDIPISIQDIDRIEVTRGPNSASYGANSFLGVINIITQHSSESQGNHISTTRGTGYAEAMYRHGGHEGNLDYRVTVAYREDDGLNNKADTKREQILTARADWRPNNIDQVEFQFGYNGGPRDEGNVTVDPLSFQRTKNIQNHFELMRWRRTLSADADLSIQAYHNREHSEDPITTPNLTPLIAFYAPSFVSAFKNPTILLINNNVTTERYDIEAQHTTALSPNLRLAWGGSLRLDQLTAPLFLGTEKTQNFRLARLFGSAELHPTESLTVNGGMMLENNSFTGFDVTPKLGANLQLIQGQTIRTGFSMATRTPNYVEEMFNRKISVPTLAASPAHGLPVTFQYFLDSGNLKPERITSFELGYLGEFQNLQVDARIYHDFIRDYIKITHPANYVDPTAIFTIPNSDLKDYTNNGSINMHGLELQTQWRMSNETRLLFNYAYERIINHVPNNKDLEESAPRSSFSLLAMKRFNSAWSGSLGYYQVGAMQYLGDGNPTALTRRIDGRLAYNFKINTVNAQISTVVQNIVDNNYQEFARNHIMGRRAYVNLQLDF